ncbi:hypothetical protein B0H17DRAFT_1175752 [Mycena rosella]|uniref:Uncharacterized protein n=1 Tax=Mycena rosella TaxID=1033263 RepID=A0AAD7GS57_MYCRO|nr:hypothetical protein B0H17DRAFT_1175752 [Mycena rosella]
MFESNCLSLRGAAAVVARSWALSPPSARRKRAGGEEAARSGEDEREGVGCEGIKDGVHGDVLRGARSARGCQYKGRKEKKKTATHEQKNARLPHAHPRVPDFPSFQLNIDCEMWTCSTVENVADARGDEAQEGAEGVCGLGGEVVLDARWLEKNWEGSS